ncbi:MAG: hypothetical protein ACI9KS_002220 [Sulfitobacter sp.]|jgi:hypothetical protein
MRFRDNVMRKTLLALATLPFLTLPVFADAETDSNFIAERTVTAEALRATMEVLGPILAQAIEFQLSQNQIELSDPEGFISLIGQEFEGVYLEELKAQTAALQREVFTADELAGIAAFYATPAGEALILKTPSLMQRSQQIGEQLGALALREAGFRLAQRIEDEGISFTEDPAMMNRLRDLLGR